MSVTDAEWSRSPLVKQAPKSHFHICNYSILIIDEVYKPQKGSKDIHTDPLVTKKIPLFERRGPN